MTGLVPQGGNKIWKQGGRKGGREMSAKGRSGWRSSVGEKRGIRGPELYMKQVRVRIVTHLSFVVCFFSFQFVILIPRTKAPLPLMGACLLKRIPILRSRRYPQDEKLRLGEKANERTGMSFRSRQEILRTELEPSHVHA